MPDDDDEESWAGWDKVLLSDDGPVPLYYWHLDTDIVDVMVAMDLAEDVATHYPLIEFIVEVADAAGNNLLPEVEKDMRFNNRREAAQAGVKWARRELMRVCRNLNGFRP